MLYLRMFLSINTYPNISAETFGGMGAFEPLSPMNLTNPMYADVSPQSQRGIMNARSLVTSQDLSRLVLNSM